VESDVDAEIEESGSGSREDGSGSGAKDSAADFSHRQRSFYDDPPEFDYEISFDIFSRPPVEVVTRRMHGGRRRDDATVHFPLQTDASSRLKGSVHLPSFLFIVTMFLSHNRHYAVLAGTTFVSHCCHAC